MSNALIDQLHLYDNIDGNNRVLSIFLNFQKHFDSVNIDILLNKLYFYGIKGICHSLLKSYLTYRNQYSYLYKWQILIKQEGYTSTSRL